MKKAAGTIFYSTKTNRIFLLLRSEHVKAPNTWGFVGGKIEDDEKILQGLSREVREEIGYVPRHLKVLPMDVFTTKDQEFRYYSYVVVVEKEFVPRINYESSGWGWFSLDSLPKPLHSGAKSVMDQPDFKENIISIIQKFIESSKA